MKKFVLKLCIFTFIIILLLFAINTGYTNTNSYYNLLVSREVARFEYIPDTISIANLGSSHGLYGFNYDEINVDSCFNFSMCSQDFVYDYNMLDYYQERFESGAIVFLPISYFSLYGANIEKAANFENSNLRYYHILDYKHIFNADLEYYIKNRYSPILLTDYTLLYNSIITDVETDSPWPNRTSNAGDIKNLEERAVVAHDRHYKADDPTINGQKSDALEDILNYCAEKNLQAVIVTTPYLECYTSLFSDEFLKNFNDDVKYYSDKYNVPYLDYSHDEQFSNNLELFYDPDHLNVYGGRAFTSTILNDCKSQGIVPPANK